VHDLSDGPQLEFGARDDAASALGSAVAAADGGSSGASVGENGEGELEAHDRLDLCGRGGEGRLRVELLQSLAQPFSLLYPKIPSAMTHPGLGKGSHPTMRSTAFKFLTSCLIGARIWPHPEHTASTMDKLGLETAAPLLFD
jgi:hypothetical protein